MKNNFAQNRNLHSCVFFVKYVVLRFFNHQILYRKKFNSHGTGWHSTAKSENFTCYVFTISMHFFPRVTWLLKVFLSIFDQTLKTYDFWIDNVRPNSFYYLVLKIYDDLILDDTVLSSGGNELIKIETSNSFYFCHDYLILMKLLPFDCK